MFANREKEKHKEMATLHENDEKTRETLKKEEGVKDNNISASTGLFLSSFKVIIVNNEQMNDWGQ